MKLFSRFSTILLVWLAAVSCAYAQQKTKIYQFKIHEEIGPPAWRTTQKAVAEAEKLGADYILLHLNTYGGLVDAADSIRTRLLNAKPIVVVFIDNNAASAGALISIACDSIYMRKSATIGAATVVNQTGEVVPDKYQSYMRATMRATAESTGRDPQIAEAMVDPSVEIAGIIDSGKVLTFTSSEALKYGFSNGTAETMGEVISKLGIENYELVKQELTATDSIINFLISPAISGILILVILGGIYFELQTPGIGFPLLAAVTAAILYFAPLYLEGMAANWEILLFLLGLILFAVELFVLPGFGIAGIAGITAILVGLIFSLLENDGFDFQFTGMAQVFSALLTVLIPFTVIAVSFFLFGDKILQNGPMKRLVLNDTQEKNQGFVVAEKSSFLGQTGRTITPLRPSGKIEIQGTPHDARVKSGYLEKDVAVEVIGQERFELLVRQKES